MASIPLTPTTIRLTDTSKLGGPYQGFSGPQTKVMFKNSEDIMTRRILRDSWNTPNAVGNLKGKGRVITPFRAVNNLGDYLGRQQYVCGGSNQVNANRPGWKSIIGSIISQCDGTGVAASVCNNRYVPDSSDYIKFKKQMAVNANYNDLKNGGDRNNASQVPLSTIRRF